MSGFVVKWTAAGLAALMALGTVVPVSAAPPAPRVEAKAPLVKVQGVDMIEEERRNRRNRQMRRGDFADDFRHGPRRREFRRHDRPFYYNGHRGYRDRRPGYRYHDGWWLPPAAFMAGAIIGSQVVRPEPREYRREEMSRAHIEWCHARYRSYREWDNTFQPYDGPRQQCYSPYS